VDHCGVSGSSSYHCGAHSAGRNLLEGAIESCSKVWLQKTRRGHVAPGNRSRPLKIHQAMGEDCQNNNNKNLKKID